MKRGKMLVMLICFVLATGSVVAKDGEAEQNRRIEYHQDEIEENYAKDNFYVYYNGLVIKDASASSFEILEDGYARDRFYAYYRGEKIANNSGLEYLGKGYAKDRFSVYYKGVKIREVSVNSFKVL